MFNTHPQDGGNYAYDDGPPDTPEERARKTAANSPQIIIPLLTELTFVIDTKLNPSTIEAKVKALLTALLKDTPEFHLTQGLIWPFHKDSNLPPISATKINQCTAILQYFHCTVNPKSIHGKLRIRLPTGVDLPNLKKTGTPLRGNLAQLKCSWNITTLESLDTTTPIFLYGIPTWGIDLKELTQDFASACQIDLNQDNIFLLASQLTRAKKTEWVIFLKCATSSAQRIVDSIAANLPLAQQNLASHRKSSRIKAMVLLPKYHPELVPEDILLAIEEQSNLLKELHEVTYTDCDSVDTPFILNQRQVTLREVIHDFKRETFPLVHNIRQETANSISISIVKEHQAIFMAQLDGIMNHLKGKGMLWSLTGHTEIPQLAAKTSTRAYYNKSAGQRLQIIEESNSNNNNHNSKNHYSPVERLASSLSDTLEDLYMGEKHRAPQDTFLPHSATWATNNISQAMSENQSTGIEDRIDQQQEKIQELELSINAITNQFNGVIEELQLKVFQLRSTIITNRTEHLEQQQQFAEQFAGRLDAHRHYTVTEIERINNETRTAEVQTSLIKVELADQTHQLHTRIDNFFTEARRFQQAINDGVTSQVEVTLRHWSRLNTPTKQRTQSSLLKRLKRDSAQPRALTFQFIPPDGSIERAHIRTDSPPRRMEQGTADQQTSDTMNIHETKWTSQRDDGDKEPNSEARSDSALDGSTMEGTQHNI
jgi:hypothetical protein